MNLEEVPLEIGQDCPLLRNLSLRSNNLTHLPENIGNLELLVDMNLLKNELVTLPHSVQTRAAC